MKKFDILDKATRTFYKAGFQLKKHGPEILVILGVGGAIGSTVLACYHKIEWYFRRIKRSDRSDSRLHGKRGIQRET